MQLGSATLDRHNDTVFLLGGSLNVGDHLDVIGPSGQSLVDWQGVNELAGPFERWEGDVLGNFFVDYSVIGAPSSMLDSTLTIPGGNTGYLVRGGTMGESFQSNFSGSFAADQTGGVYRFGSIAATLDLGCGPMVPTSGSSGYLARLDPIWSCVYSRALPAIVSAVAFTNGDVILSATSNASLDLGCGGLAPVSGGSTFVTRLDATGICVFGKSLPAPNLTVVLDSAGRVVVSGLAGAVSVDLGGGPLAPIGAQDFLLGELDAAGHFLWGRRFGGATFMSPMVSTSAAGDVYLRTGWSGVVNLGGGAITAASGDTVAGSYSASGAYRWARGFAITGAYQAGIDGCGALVVAGIDPGFNPGCGVIGSPPIAGKVAVARFAP